MCLYNNCVADQSDAYPVSLDPVFTFSKTLLKVPPIVLSGAAHWSSSVFAFVTLLCVLERTPLCFDLLHVNHSDLIRAVMCFCVIRNGFMCV